MSDDKSLEKAIAAVGTKEVQNLIKALSVFGLGVCLPHMHNEAGEMVPLPRGIVEVEEDLKVSFIPIEEAERTHTLPVSWRWDEETQMASPIRRCYDASCGIIVPPNPTSKAFP